MGRFLSVLQTEDTGQETSDGRRIWRVLSPFIYQSDVLGKTITVEKDFLTDFESSPRLPFIYFLTGDVTFSGAVVHDWLFHHHEVCDEETANKVLFEAMQSEGVSWWRRKLIYAGVQIGGKAPWEEDGSGNGHTVVNGRIV
jgi:hypothetical protein